MIKKSLHKIKENYRALAAGGVGLASPFVVSASENTSDIHLQTHQLTIPNYHTVMYDMQNAPSYHICGYGSSSEETLTRAMGETIERFAFMQMYHLLPDDVFVKASYESLKKTNNVLDLAYKHVIKNDMFAKFDVEKEYEWIELENYCTGEKVFYPAFLCAGNKKKERPILPAMSTGTAVHINYEKAMINAMIEGIQIDNFMKAWYGGERLKRVNWENTVSSAFKKCFYDIFRNEKNFEIIVVNANLEYDVFYNYITIIKSTEGKFPFCAVGVQGGLNSETTLFRSMMEAASIFINLQAFYLYKEADIKSLTVENVKKANNLDDTFLYWSNYNDYEEKNKILDTLVSDETEEFKISEVKTTKEEFVALFTQLKSKLNYLSFIDITPIEVEKYGYKAVRMVAPELIPMCFPSAPYENHPYFIKRGGIKNANFPHPLP